MNKCCEKCEDWGKNEERVCFEPTCPCHTPVQKENMIPTGDFQADLSSQTSSGERCEHEYNPLDYFCSKCFRTKMKIEDKPFPSSESWDEVELVKSIMYASDVDWEMSLQDDSVTYKKSYQLHGKILEVFKSFIKNTITAEVERGRIEVKEKVRKEFGMWVGETLTQEGLDEIIEDAF